MFCSTGRLPATTAISAMCSSLPGETSLFERLLEERKNLGAPSIGTVDAEFMSVLEEVPTRESQECQEKERHCKPDEATCASEAFCRRKFALHCSGLEGAGFGVGRLDCADAGLGDQNCGSPSAKSLETWDVSGLIAYRLLSVLA